MGYITTNIGVIVGAGGPDVPPPNSNAGALEDRFASFGITGDNIDLLVTLAGGDAAVIRWLNDLIGELATLRAAVARRVAQGVANRPVAVDLAPESDGPRPTDLRVLVRDAADGDPGEANEPPFHEETRTLRAHYEGAFIVLCPLCRAARIEAERKAILAGVETTP